MLGNFTFYNPVKLFFGKDALKLLAAELIQYGPENFPYERVVGADSYPWSRLTSPVPVYDVNGWAIWGLTGRATKVLVEEIRKRSVQLSEVE